MKRNTLSEAVQVTHQVTRFSAVAECWVDVSRRLIADDLLLLTTPYGGVLQDADAPIDQTTYRFETERLKERFGSIVFSSQGIDKRLGYRSCFIDDVLNTAGIQRSDLLDLSRTAEVDQRIASQAFLARYTRAALSISRSTEMVARIRQEVIREASKLPATRQNPLQSVTREFDQLFKEFGYSRVKRSYYSQRVVYSNENAATVLPLDFSLCVEKVPVVGYPVSIELLVTPRYDFSEVDEVLAKNFARGDYLNLVGALIPNFGRYRVGHNEDALRVSLNAHCKLLRNTLPAFEAACGELRM